MSKTLNTSIATFQIKSAFQMIDRQFFILGDILSGSIKKGMMADLTVIGIDKKAIVDTVEFALHRKNDSFWEDVGIGFSTLTETEKEFLKSGSPFSKPISIE